MAPDLNATSTFGLVERVRAGDEAAFTALFQKYSGRLAVLIRYKLSAEMRGRFDVEDLLQETFFYASRHLADFSYQRPGSFMSWLARIADHTIVDAVRRRQRLKRSPEVPARPQAGGEMPAAEPVDPTTPSRILARKEKYEQAVAILDRLPDDYRTVILLAKLEGLSSQEIADRMGRTRAAVAVLLHRATQQLRKQSEAGQKP